MAPPAWRVRRWVSHYCRLGRISPPTTPRGLNPRVTDEASEPFAIDVRPSSLEIVRSRANMKAEFFKERWCPQFEGKITNPSPGGRPGSLPNHPVHRARVQADPALVPVFGSAHQYTRRSVSHYPSLFFLAKTSEFLWVRQYVPLYLLQRHQVRFHAICNIALMD
jgi:hypothetical protein